MYLEILPDPTMLIIKTHKSVISLQVESNLKS